MPNKQEVVISGVSGRFPECSSVGEFSTKLFSKSNLLVGDETRWNPRSGHDKPFMTGKIPNWNRFDNVFFGIHPKLVRNCDPMLGHLLETSFEAMVDAGVSPHALKGHNICVISCTSTSDAEILRTTEGVFLEGFGMVGHSRTMMANRISYCFNFTGPSYNIDNSWTSTVQALKRAADLVAEGSVEAAVIMSCNIITYDTLDKEYINIHWFSEDGKSSPFDVQAHGFVRSEGAASIFIQRAENAKRIYCSLLKSEVQFLGNRGRGYLRVNQQLQTFLEEFYKDFDVKPEDISYIEAHALGVEEIDTKELNAVANVFCNRKDCPLPIGSVSGNLGNSEAPKGLVSLIKAIIAMETGIIPPTINYHTPNPNVPALLSGKLKPITEPTALSADLVAVNCLNPFGSIAHLVVKRHNKTKKSQTSNDLPRNRLPRLVTFQARHEEAAREVIHKVNSMTTDVEFISMVNTVYRTPVPAYLWRGYTVVTATEVKPTEHIQESNSTKRPLWFIFSGMGSQWAGMGRDLMQIPVFAAAIDKCDQVLHPKGLDIRHIITTDDLNIFDNIINAFVGITAIQIGLVDILHAIGIVPDGFIGHSLGETSCAYADGCLTAQQAVLGAYVRGKASLETDLIHGMMAAVGLGYNTIKDRLPPTIEVACHNAPDSCSLSGPVEDMLQYVNQLQQEGVFAKAVNVGNIAFHSQYIKHVAPKLLKYLKEVIPKPKKRTSRWISSSAPLSQWETRDAKLCSAEYNTNNLLNPVLFEEACQYLPKSAILIEIAPRGLMQAILKRSVSSGSTNISLTSRTAESNVMHLLNSLGQLYLNEVDMDVNALYPPVEYPVARGTPSLADLVVWDHSRVWYQDYSRHVKTLLNQGSLETKVKFDEKDPDYLLFKHHCVNGEVVIPVSQLLMYPCESFVLRTRQTVEQYSVTIEDVTIADNLYFDSFEKELAVTFVPVSLNFEVIALESAHSLKSRNILTGRIQETANPTFNSAISIEKTDDMEEVTEMEIYTLLARFGYHLGPPFRVIRQLFIGETECIAKVQWTGNHRLLLEAFFKIVIFLEAEKRQTYFRPSSFKKLTIDFQLLNSLSKGSEIVVHYNRLCNHLVCDGLELVGLTLTPFTPNRPTSLKWRELKLQSYTDNKLSLPEFMSLSVQLTSDASLKAWSEDICHIETLVIIEEGNKFSIFTQLLSDTLKVQNKIHSKVAEFDVKTAKTYLSVSGHQSYLVAGAYNTLASLQVSTAALQNTYFLAKFNDNGTLKHNPMLKPILVYQSESMSLALLKIGNRKNTSKVYEIIDSDWLDELRQLMAENDTNHNIVVASHTLTPRQVLPLISKENHASRLRTFFIMDRNAPHFSLSCPLYSSQLSLDLPVNILSNGTWNSLRSVNLEINPQNKVLECFIKSYNSMTDMSFIGLNTAKITCNQHISEDESEVKYVDYSGYQNKQRVMGVAQLDLESNSITTDPILKWPVPADWTMEEAATVPVIYALAYYCILLKGNVKAKENILVNAGMSLIGQAVINIALKIGANVFTSVMNDKEAIEFMKMYPTVNSSHVFVMDRQDVAVCLRNMTEGKGVEVIVNCLRGKELQASIQAMGFDCRFLHLGHIRVEDQEFIGMLAFMKRTSFFGVSLDSVTNCNHDCKARLKETVELGIQKGLVKPFKRTVFSMKEGNEAFINLNETKAIEKTIISVEQNGFQNSFSRSLQINPDHFALITGKKTELWMEVAEWLVRHGVRKLAILTNEETEDYNYLRRLDKLKVRYHTDIVLNSVERLETLDSTKELFKELLCLGTVSTIVCINMDENSSDLRNLDLASRQMVPQLQQFLSLLSEDTGVCESRAVAGLPVCSIQSDSPLQTPAHVLQYLPSILDNGSQARFLVVSDKINRIYKKELLDYKTFLSLSLEEMSNLGSNIVEKPIFVEEITCSPGYQHVRHNLLPVFVIPGLDSQMLQPLFRHLINPAYTCSLPSSIQSVAHFAEHLLHDLLRVQTHGKFNLVGESWSGATALLLAGQLEAQGHQVELILVEGAPSMVQNRLRALCERYGADLPTSLLSSLLDLPSELRKTIGKMDSWEEKLHVALKQVPETIQDSVAVSLTTLHSHMMAQLQFRAHSQLFKGKVTLITQKPVSPSDLNHLSQLCLQAPKVVVTGDGSHQELIANILTASVINENVLFDWNL